jgi:peptidoglycan/LPS O-acetylase OafA/YrhL
MIGVQVQLSAQYPLPDREMSLSVLAHRLLPIFERGHSAVMFFFVLSGFGRQWGSLG